MATVAIRLARGDRRQPATLRLGVVGCERDLRQRVAEERARRAVVADLLGRQRQIEQLETGAVLVRRNVEAGHAELDQTAPQLGVVAGRAVHHLAHARRRALLLEEAVDGVAQQDLVLRQSKVHGSPVLRGG